MSYAARLLAIVVMSSHLLGPKVLLAQESLDDLDQNPRSPAPVLAAPAMPDRRPGVSSGVQAPTGSTGSAPAGDIDKAVGHAQGYFSNRITYTLVNPSGPMPTRDLPALSEVLEANAQVRVELGSRQHFAYADMSLIYQNGWLFYEDDGTGGRRSVASHDVPALRPAVIPSELYLSSSPAPWLNVLAGKKRIVWGAGFAFNPMDVLNPPKDPTNPNYQRAGNWLLRVEAPFEKFTVTGFVAPQALYTQQGIPYAMMRYPDYAPADGIDARDGFSHYLVGARLYALLFDSDVNLVYYFSNRYQNVLENQSRIGASFSRYFFTDYELHVESLFTTGSPRNFADRGCATGTGPCDPLHAMSPTKSGSGTLYPRILVGGRRQFSDDSLLSLEYYYQGDGYSDREFADALRVLAIQKTQSAEVTGSGVPSTVAESATSGAANLPQRFSFDPLRRHYLMASYSKPRICDDWTVGAVLLVGARDLSGLFSPSVSFSAREWLTLTLYGYVPIRGLGVGEVNVGNRSWSEYSAMPLDFRVLFEARVFYGE